MKNLLSAIVLIIVFSMVFVETVNSSNNSQVLLSRSIFSSEASGPFWRIFDSITLAMDKVKWREEGTLSGPPSWISDGAWYDAHSHYFLVKGLRSCFSL
jgi:hypothetical protein